MDPLTALLLRPGQLRRYHCCYCPGSQRHQAFSSHAIQYAVKIGHFLPRVRVPSTSAKCLSINDVCFRVSSNYFRRQTVVITPCRYVKEITLDDIMVISSTWKEPLLLSWWYLPLQKNTCRYHGLMLHLALSCYSCILDTMTSSNGNIFRVTSHLCGEFSGDRRIPGTKASDAELWCFLRSAPE